MRFVEHRIGDPRVVRHIKKWLNAGVLEDGVWRHVEEGTPQGGSISPLLANVYLHYVFDLWIDRWRKQAGRGDVIVVRFADDFVIGFQHRETAEQCLAEARKIVRSGHAWTDWRGDGCPSLVSNIRIHGNAWAFRTRGRSRMR